MGSFFLEKWEVGGPPEFGPMGFKTLRAHPPRPKKKDYEKKKLSTPF